MLQDIKKSWFLNYQALGKYPETFIVEGENDEASLRESGSITLSARRGSSAELVKTMRSFCAGKDIYLWFDKDRQTDYKIYRQSSPYISLHKAQYSDVKVHIIVHRFHKDPDGSGSEGKKTTSEIGRRPQAQEDAITPCLGAPDAKQIPK
jgi:hypothetical protein